MTRKKIPDVYKGWPHLLAAFYGADNKKINDLDFIYKFLRNLPGKIGMRRMGEPIVYKITKDVHPDVGITSTVIISTSHISIHTFPHGQKDGKRKPRGIQRRVYKSFFLFDCFSCKEFDSIAVLREVIKTFKPKDMEYELKYRLVDNDNIVNCLDWLNEWDKYYEEKKNEID